ncbi:transposase [Muricoccus vinaceus]
MEPCRTAEKAVCGGDGGSLRARHSTRSVEGLIQVMGLERASKSQVSRLCAEIDRRLQDFLDRPSEGDWPCPWLDATYVEEREAGRIVFVAFPFKEGRIRVAGYQPTLRTEPAPQLGHVPQSCQRQLSRA